MKRWIRFILPLLGYMAATLFLIVSATFFLMNFLPGTPYNNQEKLSPLQIEMLNQKYGFSQPLWQRYLTYIGNILRGDFGISLQFSEDHNFAGEPALAFGAVRASGSRFWDRCRGDSGNCFRDEAEHLDRYVLFSVCYYRALNA